MYLSLQEINNDSPACKHWKRFMSMDDNYREYEQPYFAHSKSYIVK